jgi:hypothetical protein
MDQKEREQMHEEMRAKVGEAGATLKKNGVSETTQQQENISPAQTPNAPPKEDATRTGPYKGKY